MNTETQLNALQSRRMKNEDKALARAERQDAAVDRMIGQLSSGKFYIFPVGGKYREGDKFELTQFLVRNNYI